MRPELPPNLFTTLIWEDDYSPLLRFRTKRFRLAPEYLLSPCPLPRKMRRRFRFSCCWMFWMMHPNFSRVNQRVWVESSKVPENARRANGPSVTEQNTQRCTDIFTNCSRRGSKVAASGNAGNISTIPAPKSYSGLDVFKDDVEFGQVCFCYSST